MTDEEIESLKKELNFYRSIDFVAMGRFIELDKQCDLTGWEFLADAWRSDNQAKALWYVQQRWNKNFHYNDIFEGKQDVENKEFRDLMLTHAHLFKMYKESQSEIEELEKEIEKLKAQN